MIKGFLKSLTKSCVTCSVLICCLTGISHADNSPDAKTEYQKTLQAMEKASVEGPYTVKLGNEAVLKLPQGFIWIPPKEAKNYMTAVGNNVADDFYGLIYHENIDGFVTIEYFPEGYIKDDDAKDWDADELLDNLKEGTKEQNKERVKKGITPFEVIGWVEKPTYNAQTHRLVWSASLQDMGSSTPEAEQGINYNTYLLGRNGYISLDLVTSRSAVEKEKPLARQLLNAVEFNATRRYEDFDPKTDHIAEYGLAALVGGIAAKKIGLLATLGVLLAKFGKIVIIALVACGVGIKQFFFGNKKKDNSSQD